jgi:hypothetical protein
MLICMTNNVAVSLLGLLQLIALSLPAWNLVALALTPLFLTWTHLYLAWTPLFPAWTLLSLATTL